MSPVIVPFYRWANKGLEATALAEGLTAYKRGRAGPHAQIDWGQGDQYPDSLLYASLVEIEKVLESKSVCMNRSQSGNRSLFHGKGQTHTFLEHLLCVSTVWRLSLVAFDSFTVPSCPPLDGQDPEAITCASHLKPASLPQTSPYSGLAAVRYILQLACPSMGWFRGTVSMLLPGTLAVTYLLLASPFRAPVTFSVPHLCFQDHLLNKLPAPRSSVRLCSWGDKAETHIQWFRYCNNYESTVGSHFTGDKTVTQRR